MTDSYPFIQLTDEGETVVTTTRPTPAPLPVYETLEQAENDESLMLRVCRAHREYRDMLFYAVKNADHPLLVAELGEALTALAALKADCITPGYQRAGAEADRLDPDLSLDAPRRAG